MNRPAMDEAMLRQAVRYQHVGKVFQWMPGARETGWYAALLGTDEATVTRLRGELDAQARQAAEELLADPAVAEQVDRLPFGPGQTVVGIGDSITDDLLSWLEILRHLLQLRRPGDGISVVNEGISAQTTTQAIRRMQMTLAARPDWILCLLGGNDTTRTGPEPAPTLVSVAETERNLLTLRRLAGQTAARWVWVTPPPVDEVRVAAHEPFKWGQSTWRNQDLAAIAEVMRGQPDPVADAHAAFDLHAEPELQGPDGLHPDLPGQIRIARTVVECLVGLEG